jgi:hypothetical protein
MSYYLLINTHFKIISFFRGIICQKSKIFEHAQKFSIYDISKMSIKTFKTRHHLDELDELINYIKLNLKKGYTKNQIKAKLIEGKWPKNIIEIIFRKVLWQNNFLIINVISTLILIMIFITYLIMNKKLKLISDLNLFFSFMIAFLFIEIVIIVHQTIISIKNKYLYTNIIQKIRPKPEDRKKEEKPSLIIAEEFKTDVDRLYELVQEKGKIKISEVMQILNVTKKKAEEWALILAEHGLIDICYLTFGGLELRKIEKK